MIILRVLGKARGKNNADNLYRYVAERISINARALFANQVTSTPLDALGLGIPLTPVLANFQTCHPLFFAVDETPSA